jgi:hypothetical protein
LFIAPQGQSLNKPYFWVSSRLAQALMPPLDGMNPRWEANGQELQNQTKKPL